LASEAPEDDMKHHEDDQNTIVLFADGATYLRPPQEFLVRTKQEGKPDIVVGRRYGAFIQLDKDVGTLPEMF